MFFLIQGIALVAFFLFFVSFHLKTRKVLLTLQALSLFLWGVHFALLTAWTGMLISVINSLITVLFVFKENKLLRKFMFPASFLMVIVAALLTWDQYSQFALMGVCFMLIAKWQTNLKRIRQISILANISWIIYDYFVGSWGGVLAEILFTFSVIISLKRNKAESESA